MLRSRLGRFLLCSHKNLHLGVGMPVSAIPESQHLKGDVKTLSSTVSQENSSGKTVET